MTGSRARTSGARLAIVADDLTGAADAAAPFASGGDRVVVVLDVDRGDVGGADVLSVSTASRSASPEHARDRVDATVRALGTSGGIATWFKKVDSTLRGHVGVEVDAMVGALRDVSGAGSGDGPGGRLRPVVCPAFPAVGRSVLDGRSWVTGGPGRGTAVAEVIASTSAGGCGHVPLEVVRGEVGALVDALCSVPGDRVVVDAVTDGDLDAIAAAVRRAPHTLLPVGSGGLAAAFARASTRPAASAGAVVPSGGVTAPDRATLVPAERVLVVVGSRQRVSEEQVLELAGRADVTLVDLPTDDLASWPGRLTRGATGGAAATAVVVRAVDVGGDGDARSDPDAVRDRLADAVAALVEGAREPPDALLLVGGEVAAAVLAAVGASAIRLTGEVEAGLPIGTLVGGGCAGAPTVTKAGGFGHRRSLTAAVDVLRRVNPEDP